MTDPSAERPVPGPPRPGPAAGDGRPTDGVSAPGRSDEHPGEPAEETAQPETTSFDDLAGRPVAEHVGVYEAEHARLQRELGTIDQL